MKNRIYGDEKTMLTLSARAEEIVNDTDPIEIIEHEDENGVLSYSVRGLFDEDGLTAEEVSARIEQAVSCVFATVHGDAIKVTFNTRDGDEDGVYLSKHECSYFTAAENFDGLIESVTDRAGYTLCPADVYYLKHALYSVINAWSAIQDPADRVREIVTEKIADAIQQLQREYDLSGDLEIEFPYDSKLDAAVDNVIDALAAAVKAALYWK